MHRIDWAAIAITLAVVVIGIVIPGCSWWTTHRDTVLELSVDLCVELANKHDRPDLAGLCRSGGNLAPVIDRILSEKNQCVLGAATEAE